MLRSLALVLALLAPTPAAAEDLCSGCKSIWHFFAWLDTNWLGTAFREIAPWNGKWSKPTVLYLEGGGFIHEHMQRWREVRQSDADIEIRGPCFSACTLIMAVVPKERLCFGDYASLQFHAASDLSGRIAIGAVYIVGYSREMPDAAKWLLAVLAIAIGGMPILFQFQGNDQNAAAVTWGLVDNFLAGIAAVAVASCMRSARTHSIWWAVAAMLAAAFGFMIKPAGLLVMALVGASWLLLITFQVRWNLFRLWREPVLRRYCVVWLIAAGIIYGSTIIAAFSSPY